MEKPGTRVAAGVMSVAGGQIATSTPPACLAADAIASNSASAPFIFQFPAINFRNAIFLTLEAPDLPPYGVCP